MIVLNFIGFTLLSIATGLLFMGLGRKLTARIQRRYGPPFWQNFTDVGKLFSKQSISHSWVMDFGIIMGFTGVLATVFFLPIGPWHAMNSMQGNLIIMIYFMTIGYLGMAMGVSASGNPNATIGISRALTLMVGYEIPFVITIIVLIFSYKSSLLPTIVAGQAGSIWNWNMFKFPFAFIAAEMALQGMMGEKPFDAMIAPAEIASGPMVELSGKMMGLGMLQHAAGIFLETGLMVNLFWGGASTVWGFILKQFAVFFIAILVNAVFPRYRYEDGVKWFWKYPTVLALIQLVIYLV